MRDILFKAKMADTNEWVIGYYIYYKFLNVHVIWNLEKGGIEWIDPSTLCQFTGLFDKNGNRIWENDVVYYDDEFWEVEYYSRDAQFGICNNNNFLIDFGIVDNTDCEVFGNIFDNPELLKEV